MKDWWQSLLPRERLIVAGGAAVLAVFGAYTMLIAPLFDGAKEYRAKAAQAQEDLIYMQRVAPQVSQSASANGNRRAAGQTLTRLVDSTRRTHKLNTSDTQQVGDDGLRVKLDDAAFNAIVAWLGDLKGKHGVEIEAANVRQTKTAGTADANITLRQAQP